MNTPNLIMMIFALLTYVFLLRFFMQLSQANFFNPISQTLIKITAPILKPLNMILPNTSRFNSASLLVAIALQILAVVAVKFYFTQAISFDSQAVISGLLKFVIILFDFFFYAAIVYALLSWVLRDPNHPLNDLLYSILSPILKPIQSIIPPLGGLDFSVMILIFGLSFLKSQVVQLMIKSFGLM